MRTVSRVPAVCVLVASWAIAGCVSSGAESAPSFDLQGHRGARGLAPENTLPGFERALDLEVDTLELDLHFSADAKLVVWHDPEIRREKCRLDPSRSEPPAPDPDADGPAGALRVRRLTRAQLARYRCDRNPAPDRFPLQSSSATALAGADYHIVELETLFDFVERYAHSESKSGAQRRAASRVHYSIETKRDPEDPTSIGDGFDGEAPGPFERALEGLVRSRGLAERVTVQSFDHRSLWAMRQLDPNIALAALTEGAVDLESLRSRGASVWSPWHEQVNPEKLALAHRLGLRVVPWTVNDAARIQILRELGVDGVITDRPDLLR